jgi:hypothetical protein
MEIADYANLKHVFVCGLPRSGTSVLGRNVARLEGCTSFKNTGVLEDEGQFLQDVYASDHERGGSGSFGFHADSHLTEASALLTPPNAERLRHCWERHWDPSKRIRIEKTPGNLLMTRFLQAIFPHAYFVVMKRHPISVSMATQKWKDSVRSLDCLFRHWLHCHELFERDRKHLKHVYELTYEDYVGNPDKYHQEIAAFIGTRLPEPPKQDTFRYVVEWHNRTGLRVPEGTMEQTSGAYNQKYLDRWSDLVRNSRFKSYYSYLIAKYEDSFAKHGYSLTLGLSDTQTQSCMISWRSRVTGSLLCTGADSIALSRRLFVRSKEWLRIHSKQILPESVVNKIRRSRVKRQKKQADASASALRTES